MSALQRRWEATTGSAMGSSHRRNGLPNQDAVAVLDAPGGTVAVVADGHGGARYVRSDVGSALAVEVATAVGAEALARLGDDPDRDRLVDEVGAAIPAAVVSRWRTAVTEHHRLHPFTDEERTRGGADLDGDPHLSYGATLVMAVLAEHWAGLVQIGDGDASVAFDDGRVSAPVPGDDRLVGGETTSLCLPGAARDARSAVLLEPLPSLIVLTSDGYANSFADPDWRERAVAELADLVEREGIEAVTAELPAWLADSAEASGDDVTMALVRRLGDAGAAVPPPAARPVAAPARPAAPSSDGGGSRAGRVVLAIVAGLALLAAGFGIGLVAGGEEVAGTPTSTSPDPTDGLPTTTVATSTTVVLPLPDTVLTVGGAVVGFTADPLAPHPRVIATTDRPDDRVVGHARWKLQGGRLWRKPGARWLEVTEGPPVGAAVSRNGRIWAIDPNGDQLWSFDEAGGALGPIVEVERERTATDGGTDAEVPATWPDGSAPDPSPSGSTPSTSGLPPAGGDEAEQVPPR